MLYSIYNFVKDSEIKVHKKIRLSLLINPTTSSLFLIMKCFQLFTRNEKENKDALYV